MLDFKDYNSIIVTHYAIGKANNSVKKGNFLFKLFKHNFSKAELCFFQNFVMKKEKAYYYFYRKLISIKPAMTFIF